MHDKLDNNDLLSIRTFDTKRTIFVKDGHIKVVNDFALDAEKQEQELPVWQVGAMEDATKVKPGRANDNSIYKVYPEKGRSVDYTQRIINMAQAMERPGRKLIGVHNATSYGYVNNNNRLYHLDSIVANAKTFYNPNPIPFIYDHDTHRARKTIGRVFHAHPVYLDIPQNKMNDLRIPKAYIKVYSIITDPDAIDGIMDNRYLTISSGFRPNFNTVTCSICDTPYHEECEHYPGKMYDKEFAYTVVHDMRYRDVSYVSSPADLHSRNIKWEVVETEGKTADGHVDSSVLKTMFDNHEVEYMMDGLGDASDISLYMLDDKSEKTVVDLFDMEEKKMSDIFGNKWQCIGDVCKVVSVDSEVDENRSSEPIVGTVNDNIKGEGEEKVNSNEDEEIHNKRTEATEDEECATCPDKQTHGYDGTSEEYGNDESEDDYMKNVIAALDMVQPLLEDKDITVEDAIAYLKDAGVVMLFNDDLPEIDKFVELIDSTLADLIVAEEGTPDEGDENGKDGDAKISTAARKRLPKSTFCGPNRSFPVPDCAHVTAARRLIGRYKGPGNKQRILACVSRKAKSLGCDK
jgi:hypothetical protein